MIDEDPDLGAPELKELRNQVMRRYGKAIEFGRRGLMFVGHESV